MRMPMRGRMKIQRIVDHIILLVVPCLLVVLCAGVLLAGVARADSIELRNGRNLQGKYIGGTATTIGFMTLGAVEYFATSDVIVLIFDKAGDSTTHGLQPDAMHGSSSGRLSPARLSPAKPSQAKPSPAKSAQAKISRTSFPAPKPAQKPKQGLGQVKTFSASLAE